jgi:sulfane dehydrogenase subunit SoxC
MGERSKRVGRVRAAPENFLSADDLAAGRSGRRDFLRSAMVAAGAAASVPLAARVPDADPAIVDLPRWTTTPGQPVATRPYGLPSQHQSALTRRELPGLSAVGANSASFCPLQGLFGIITPSGLHYERHHHGWHDIDPARHRLMINAADPGLINKAKIYTVDELMRLPPISRMYFIECGGNTGTERERATAPTVQYTHGMISCSEFTGIPLRKLLEDCGVDFRRARFVLAEGADGASLTRTISMGLIESGEVLVAYGQNGEMLRPENGFPLRLVVPGVQGISWVKWLRRIEVGDAPYATREESLQYIDLMPDGQHRQYTSLQECKSVITTPSGGQTLLNPGFYNISGLAWSGRGRIERVDVSVDGGRSWRSARLETPVLSKALTRFNMDWVWHGEETVLQSRAIDETGFVQPTYGQLRAARGTGSIYHNNAIQSWRIRKTGEVVNVQVV